MTADINRLLDEYRDACVAYKENCDALSVATEARKWRDAARAAIIAAWEEREAKIDCGDAERLSARITEYLSAGGLWNPECMDHDKVRRLLIDCRTEFDAAIADSAIKSAIAQVDAARTAERELAALRNRPCPYVHSSGEGTHYCTLPHAAEKELAELRKRIDEAPRGMVRGFMLEPETQPGWLDKMGGKHVAIVPLREGE